jgi:hypothetical protein
VRHPALDQRERGLQPGQRDPLLGRVDLFEHPAAEGFLHALGVLRVEPLHRLLERPPVHGDAPGVGVDRVQDVPAQPADVAEEAVVGGLAQRDVQPHLVGGQLQALGEPREVRRQQRPDAGAERQADVAGGQHLRAERAEPLPDLPAEHHAADPAQHPAEPARTAERAQRPQRTGLPEGTGVPGQERAHRLHHAARDRVAQPLPRRQRRGDPLQPAPPCGGFHAGGQTGDRVEPQIGEAQRVVDLGAFGRGQGAVALPGEPGGDLVGKVPVHGAAGGGEDLLQLRHERGPLWVVRVRPLAAARQAEAEGEVGHDVLIRPVMLSTVTPARP